MSTKKTSTAITDLESELAGLQRRRSSLQARHDAAVAALDAAKANRRAILTSEDDPAPAKLAAADKAVRDADDARQAAAEAGEEIAALIESTSTRLAGLIDAEQRERRAAEMEASAIAADAALARILKASKEVGAARQALADALGSTCSPLYTPPVQDSTNTAVLYLGTKWYSTFSSGQEFTDALSALDVADRMAGHVLAATLHSLSITSQAEFTNPGLLKRALCPIGSAPELRDVLIKPMRTHAAALRDGAAPMPESQAAWTRAEIARSASEDILDEGVAA